MKLPFDRSRFAGVVNSPSAAERGEKYLSYIEDQIRHDTWQEFHDDVFALPANARRLYLPLCFDVGVRGDGMPDAFSFYGYSGDSLIREITEGFNLIGLPQIAAAIDQAYRYWQNPDSPMHSDSIPWLRMDKDVDDVHGRYYRDAKELFALVGSLVSDWGEERVHQSPD